MQGQKTEFYDKLIFTDFTVLCSPGLSPGRAIVVPPVSALALALALVVAAALALAKC